MCCIIPTRSALSILFLPFVMELCLHCSCVPHVPHVPHVPRMDEGSFVTPRPPIIRPDARISTELAGVWGPAKGSAFLRCEGAHAKDEVEITIAIEAHRLGTARQTHLQHRELDQYRAALHPKTPKGTCHSEGRSRSGQHSLSPEDIRYVMDIVVQPPRTARVGQTMPGSIVVRLRTINADTDDAVADSTNLVAVAALVPGPNSAVPADPNALNTLLTGRVFDSIHPFNDDEADGFIASMDMADPQGVGYMRFPDLVIRQAGTYRIRITLIRIRNSASDPPVTSAGNGLAVHVVDSNPIVVNGGGSGSNMAVYNARVGNYRGIGTRTVFSYTRMPALHWFSITGSEAFFADPPQVYLDSFRSRKISFAYRSQSHAVTVFFQCESLGLQFVSTMITFNAIYFGEQCEGLLHGGLDHRLADDPG
ncbi:conserved hypothetical protein [Pyrenophora tritici-repentis Pt-1C-BFP]|uniref:Velvet domain-containing protein n=1 Tax=Pyrenophora tritici-repentis (strain Pt-1C-BFP) TaxID=426418 RepID=B2VTH4_PYRTR|nr:uncharacterized protein PTRG_01938 [Pyrenophora tritici-repentis Pt-1C-BFP]EDU41376.1 conserved hypothetical protein [Pyrenophora tritici-repentis Pt-1C-BFP]